MAGVLATVEIGTARHRKQVGDEVLRFAVVGVGSTLAHLSLFTVLLHLLGTSQLANLIALVMATVANTTVNRRWTFGVRGCTAAMRHHVQAFVVFGITWGLSAAALGLLHQGSPDPQPILQVVVVGLSMVGSTVIRFTAMRVWIFRSTL